MPQRNACFHASVACTVIPFLQGAAESGLGDLLDQVAIAGNIFHQELVDAYPQVRAIDFYNLTAVSLGDSGGSLSEREGVLFFRVQLASLETIYLLIPAIQKRI